MNNRRRKTLNAVLNELERLRSVIDKQEAEAILQDAQITVEQCADEEQDALDGLPENLQWSAKSDAMNDNVYDLNEASSDLDALADDVKELDNFNYDSIKSEVVKIYNSIQQAIHR